VNVPVGLLADAGAVCAAEALADVARVAARVVFFASEAFAEVGFATDVVADFAADFVADGAVAALVDVFAMPALLREFMKKIVKGYHACQ
jgi:phosphoribosylaminoimidazole (AIR) synthetase